MHARTDFGKEVGDRGLVVGQLRLGACLQSLDHLLLTLLVVALKVVRNRKHLRVTP